MSEPMSDAVRIQQLETHVKALQLVCMKALEDWWPLVYDRTCRHTVRAQGDAMRAAIEGKTYDPAV